MAIGVNLGETEAVGTAYLELTRPQTALKGDGWPCRQLQQRN